MFDVLGRPVAQLHSGPLAPGTHSVRVDVAGLPAGVYVVRAVTAADAAVRPLAVVR